MTATDEQVIRVIARPAAWRIPAVLVIFFLFVKVGQFTLAIMAMRGGVAEPMFATGLPMVAWDSVHYLTIAARGYPLIYGQTEQNIAFFPVLPLISRLIIPVMGPGLAVLTVSNVTSLVGLLLFYAWCRRMMGERESFWACLLLIAYPPGMFLSAAYTEGVFMVTTGAALYFSAGRRPWLATLAAAVGSAVRPTGIMVSLVIVTDAVWRTARGERVRAIPRFLAMAMISVSGLALFAGFLTVRYKSPMRYFDVQDSFVHDQPRAAPAATAGSMSAIAEPAESPAMAKPRRGSAEWLWFKVINPGTWNNVLAMLGVLASILILIPRLPIPRHILLLPLLIFLLGFVPAWGARVNSCARYLVEALPLFAAMAFFLIRRTNTGVRVGLMLLSFTIQSIYIWQFTRGDWAG